MKMNFDYLNKRQKIWYWGMHIEMSEHISSAVKAGLMRDYMVLVITHGSDEIVHTVREIIGEFHDGYLVSFDKLMILR